MNIRNDGAEWSDWAALFVLGAVTPEERELCERRLRSDAAFRAEVERLRPTVASLALGAEPVAPPPGLFARVRERAGLSAAPASGLGVAPAAAANPAQPWKHWRAADSEHPFNYVAAAAGDFLPTAVPGVEVRKLHVDEAADKVTMLVRMSAGSSYPAHRHGGPEECFVLAGDLQIGTELHMRGGDFQRAEAGSVHPVQSTRDGCLLLITSSMHDELLLLGAS